MMISSMIHKVNQSQSLKGWVWEGGGGGGGGGNSASGCLALHVFSQTQALSQGLWIFLCAKIRVLWQCEWERASVWGRETLVGGVTSGARGILQLSTVRCPKSRENVVPSYTQESVQSCGYNHITSCALRGRCSLIQLQTG